MERRDDPIYRSDESKLAQDYATLFDEEAKLIQGFETAEACMFVAIERMNNLLKRKCDDKAELPKNPQSYVDELRGSLIINDKVIPRVLIVPENYSGPNSTGIFTVTEDIRKVMNDNAAKFSEEDKEKIKQLSIDLNDGLQARNKSIALIKAHQSERAGILNYINQVMEIAGNIPFWHGKGKGFLGKEITPAGIKELRKVILKNWDPLKYNPATYKKEVTEILNKLRDFGKEKLEEAKLQSEDEKLKRQGITGAFYSALYNENKAGVQEVLETIRASQPLKTTKSPGNKNL